MFSAYLDLIGTSKKFWSKLINHPTVLVSNSQGIVKEASGEANLAHVIRELWAASFSPSALRAQGTKDLTLLVCLKPEPERRVDIHSFAKDASSRSKLQVKVDDNHYEVNRKNVSEIDLLSTSGKPISRTNLNTLIALFLELEKYLYFPISAQFLLTNNQITINHILPLTPFDDHQSEHSIPNTVLSQESQVSSNHPLTPGRKTAPVRIVRDRQEAEKKVLPGDILVISETNHHFVSILKKTSGIILKKGDCHCHAAVFAKKHGIPSIVIDHTTLSLLRDGHVITLDGTSGEVRT